jgi:hypothetical protein
VSSISRYRVRHQPISRRVSAVTDLSWISRAQTPVVEPESGIEPLTCSLRVSRSAD